MGYILWLHLGAYAVVSHTIKMPVYFYNTNDTEKNVVPEHVTVTIQGPRHVMRNLAEDDYGVFVNAQDARKDSPLLLKRAHLFLPTSINVVSFSPHKIQLF